MLGRAILLVFGAMILAGCVPGQDVRYFREGIGSDLYSSSGAETAQLQKAYVSYVCGQTGLSAVYEEGGCIPDRSRDWELFVQAGMNDIDARCDAYLAWLDDKRRSAGPILQEISDIRTATSAIMAVTGSGVTPIAVVGSAFGLASSTFANIQSRLVLEVNHSTVQTIVLVGQRRMRAEILRTRIDNRPIAMHALRQYLRICQPFTIETEINTTVTAFERGGASGVAYRDPLVDASTVRSPISSTITPIAPSVRPPVTRDAVRIGEFESRLDKATIQTYQARFCIRPANGKFTPETRSKILALLRTRQKDSHFPDRITDLDGSRLQAMIEDEPPLSCARDGSGT